jgi:hypothetical protein
MNENIVSVSGNDFQDILSTFHLRQNYPNPFNAETVISFVLPTSGKVSIKVYNLLGEEIVTVMEDYLPAGEREVKFNGEGLTSGIYFYQLKTEGQFSTKKFVLMK